MRRILLPLSILVAFAAGWTLGAGRSSTAEARPKATCKDDLARSRGELTKALGERDQARAMLDELLAKEKERVRLLEEQIGQMVKDLK
jgi:hypothetical protein